MRLTKELKRKLLAGAEDEGTYGAAARKAGIDPKSLWTLRQRHPGLDAELQAAFDRGIERDYELARKGLSTKLKAMESDPDTFDMPTARLALQRHDRRWGSQYREVDVKATVAIEDALRELDERGSND